MLLLLSIAQLSALQSHDTVASDNNSYLIRYLTVKGKGGDGDSSLGISSVGKGNKGSKSSKESKSTSSKGKGNTFVHDDEDCDCERRRRARRLGIGYQPPCVCPDGKGSSKDSKGDSGKGKGGGVSGEDDDDDEYNHHIPTKPPVSQPVQLPTMPSSQPQPSPSQNLPTQPQLPPSTPSNALPTRPRPSIPDGAPSTSPISLPPSEREPSSPTDGTPTSVNQPTPSGGTPTDGNQPTTDGGTPTNGSQPSPSQPTPDGGGTPRCQLSTQGLFGSNVGLSEEFFFSYQTLVIPSVTVGELNIDMLPKLEQDMGEQILTRTFPQCSSGSPTITDSNAEVQRSNSQDLPSGQRLLQNAGTGVTGFSTRPRDLVNEGIECTNVEPVFPCYVIEGVVTVYSISALTPQENELFRNSIQQSIENGNLENSDNRFLGVTWRGHGVGDESNGDGDGDNGDGSSNGGGSAGGDPNDSNEDIDRADTTGGGLEPWTYAIIAIGGVLVLTMLFFCFRRPVQRRVDAEANERSGYADDPSNSKSSDDRLDNESDGEESENDVYTEDYDESRATPLIQNTSSRQRSYSNEPIEEEASENDGSYEALRASAENTYGTSNSGNNPKESLQGQGNLNRREMPEDLVADTEKESPSAIFGSKDKVRATDRDVTMDETSDSAYSSYEEVVEEEYEIEYAEDSPHRDGSGVGPHWADEHVDEDIDHSGGNESLPILANSAQLGRKTAIDSMLKKWENPL
ncbi:hypothetical protein IV203_012491 [Nitzschia inconspicua]|uniref:Uncharacterized protein n=1 Tax=Nitzschia inconspicua TaxID=303405 RepID=A0A9K3KTU9_9STRA|nr:hypothetical protein IV203_012491 [Nitzschia inconspicua]